jgi:hypothetical protein
MIDTDLYPERFKFSVDKGHTLQSAVSSPTLAG